MNESNKQFLHRVMREIESQYGKRVRSISEHGFHFYMDWFEKHYSREEAFPRSISMLDPSNVAQE